MRALPRVSRFGPHEWSFVGPVLEVWLAYVNMIPVMFTGNWSLNVAVNTARSN